MRLQATSRKRGIKLGGVSSCLAAPRFLSRLKRGRSPEGV